MINGKKVYWSRALTDKKEALTALISLFLSNSYGEIKIVKNKDCFHFISANQGQGEIWDYDCKWIGQNTDYKPKYGTLSYELHHNYIPCFSTQKARELYIKEGKVTQDLFAGIGIMTPVKIKDYQDFFKTDNFPYFYKTHEWFIKKEKSCDLNIDNVYVVDKLNETMDSKNFLEEVKRAIEFLQHNELN